jgi:hypothetical protein
VNIGTLKDIFYLGAQINFHPYSPHLLSDMGDVLCQKSAHNAVGYLRVSWKSAQGTPYFPYVRKWILLLSSVNREAACHFEGRERLSQICVVRHRVNPLLSSYILTVHRSRDDPRRGGGLGVFGAVRGTAGYGADDWTPVGRSDRLFYCCMQTENIISSDVWHCANAYSMVLATHWPQRVAHAHVLHS